jgi:hypothetical protein
MVPTICPVSAWPQSGLPKLATKAIKISPNALYGPGFHPVFILPSGISRV